jgi:hypothetical protein
MEGAMLVKSGARAFLTIFLVVVMAGTAVAFAVGVNFSPQKTVCVHPIQGSSYQICLQVPPGNVSRINVKGFALQKLRHGHINLNFTNSNSVPVKLKLLLVIRTKSVIKKKSVIRTKSGKTRSVIRTKSVFKIQRYVKTATVLPGRSFKFNRRLKKGILISAGKLSLTITDASGDKALIKKHFGKFG